MTKVVVERLPLLRLDVGVKLLDLLHHHQEPLLRLLVPRVAGIIVWCGIVTATIDVVSLFILASTTSCSITHQQRQQQRHSLVVVEGDDGEFVKHEGVVRSDVTGLLEELFSKPRVVGEHVFQRYVHQRQMAAGREMVKDFVASISLTINIPKVYNNSETFMHQLYNSTTIFFFF